MADKKESSLKEKRRNGWKGRVVKPTAKKVEKKPAAKKEED